MLTQNQKQLIEKLEGEFAKLNKPLEKEFDCISIYLNPHREDVFNDIDALCADSRFVREIESLYYKAKKQ